jgi:hypothetical protein
LGILKAWYSSRQNKNSPLNLTCPPGRHAL